MIYRLLALNIDGTLLQSNGKIHKSTKEAISMFRQKGIYVTLMTSQSFSLSQEGCKGIENKKPTDYSSRWLYCKYSR